MPYKKRYSRKKKYRRKKPTRYQNYATGFGQLARDVSKLKSLINVEFKYKDNALNSTVNSSGTIQLVNGLAQDDTSVTRDGASVRFKSIQLKGFMAQNETAKATACRRLVVIDKQPNQTLATISEVLDTSVFTLTNALRNLDHRKRFVILRDDHMMLNEDGNEAGWLPDVFLNLDMITIYNGTAGTIADIETNALYVIYISSEATNAPTIAHSSRVRFIDN